MEVGVKPVTYGCSRSQVKKMYPEGRNYCHPSVSMEDPHGYQNLRMLQSLFIIQFLFQIRVQLIYNVVLVLGVQQSDLVIHIHISILLQIIFPYRLIQNFFFFGCVGPSLLRGLSLVVDSGGYSSLWCTAFSLRWLLLLRSMDTRCAGFSSCCTRAKQLWHGGSIVVAHGLSCSAAWGIFPDQGQNLCPLHWQVDS